MVTGVDILQDFGVLPNSGSQNGDIFGARRGVIFAAETRKKPEPRRRESANCVRSLGCADGLSSEMPVVLTSHETQRNLCFRDFAASRLIFSTVLMTPSVLLKVMV